MSDSQPIDVFTAMQYRPVGDEYIIILILKEKIRYLYSSININAAEKYKHQLEQEYGQAGFIIVRKEQWTGINIIEDKKVDLFDLFAPVIPKVSTEPEPVKLPATEDNNENITFTEYPKNNIDGSMIKD